MRRQRSGVLSRLSQRAGLGATAPAVVSLGRSQVVGAIASVVGLAFLARNLPIGTFGEVIFAQATAGIIYAILDPRLGDGVIAYVPRILDDQGSPAASRLFMRALTFDEFFGLFSAAMLLLLLSSGVIAPHATTAVFLGWSVVQFGVQTGLSTASAGFALTGGLVLLGRIRVVAVVATTTVSVLALLAAGAVGYLIAQAVCGAALTALVMVLGYRRILRTYGRPGRLPSGLLRGFAPFTMKSSLSTSVGIGANNAPLSLVGAIGGAPMLATFRVGLAPARLTSTASSPLPAAMFPALSQDVADGQIGKARSSVLAWTGLLAVPIGLAAIAARFVLPFLVTLLFGRTYEGAGTIAWIFLCAALVRGMVMWSKVLPLALGRAGLKLAITSIDAVLLVAVTWWGASRSLDVIAWGHLTVAAIVSTFWLVFAIRLRSGEALPEPIDASEVLMDEIDADDLERG